MIKFALLLFPFFLPFGHSSCPRPPGTGYRSAQRRPFLPAFEWLRKQATRENIRFQESSTSDHRCPESSCQIVQLISAPLPVHRQLRQYDRDINYSLGPGTSAAYQAVVLSNAGGLLACQLCSFFRLAAERGQRRDPRRYIQQSQYLVHSLVARKGMDRIDSLSRGTTRCVSGQQSCRARRAGRDQDCFSFAWRFIRS